MHSLYMSTLTIYYLLSIIMLQYTEPERLSKKNEVSSTYTCISLERETKTKLEVGLYVGRNGNRKYHFVGRRETVQRQLELGDNWGIIWKQSAVEISQNICD